jgi:hypothetical protein
MNKTKLGMLGAVSALAALPLGAKAAAIEPAVAPAQSFSELLQPIPNAVERLDASNRALAGGGVRVMDAAYHHHHNTHNHHSAAWWRDYYRRLMWQRNNSHHHNNDYNSHHHHNNDYNNNNNHHHHNNPY